MYSGDTATKGQYRMMPRTVLRLIIRELRTPLPGMEIQSPAPPPTRIPNVPLKCPLLYGFLVCKKSDNPKTPREKEKKREAEAEAEEIVAKSGGRGSSHSSSCPHRAGE